MTRDDPASPPEPWGHQVDVGGFLRDVVHLMAYITTGPSVAMIWRRERGDRDKDEQLLKFESVVVAHLGTEIPRILISIAATFRTKVDDGSWVANDESVGWLSAGERLDPEKGEALSIREACNKIIHAKRVHPDTVRAESGAETIGALITLSGDRSGRPWTAQINLQQLCIAISNTDFYPHGTGRCRH